MLANVPAAKRLKELDLPMVRLKIENTGYPVIKSKKLNDYFLNTIANPQDFL
jgi:Mre11 DNA-binding presumed domain